MPTDPPDPLPQEVVLKMSEKQLLTHLLLSVNDLTECIRQVSDQLDARPTHDEVRRQRNQGLARLLGGVTLMMAVVVFAQDAHVEYCGPGARSEKIVNGIASGDIRERSDFERVAEKEQPAAICDAMVPLHTHDHRTGWPTAWNVVGVIFYSAVALACVWALTTRRWANER